MAFDLTHPAAPLERFGDCLGIDRAAWRGEGLDEVAAPAETRILAAKLSECQDQVVDLVEAYGDALESETGWSKIEGLSEDLELRPGLAQATIVSFLDHLENDLGDRRELSKHQLKVVLRLNKRRLLEDHLNGLSESVRPALFLYWDGLKALLSGTLSGLEQWWDEEIPGQVVLFVPEWKHFLAGPYLAVIGGEPQDGLDRLIASSPQGAHPPSGISR